VVTNVPDGSAVLRHLGEGRRRESGRGRAVRTSGGRAGSGSHERPRVLGTWRPGRERRAEVILRSAARALLNPAYTLRFTEEPFTGRPGCFTDWSQAEMDVLRELRS
jgi:hypothetical protein